MLLEAAAAPDCGELPLGETVESASSIVPGWVRVVTRWHIVAAANRAVRPANDDLSPAVPAVRCSPSVGDHGAAVIRTPFVVGKSPAEARS